MYNSDVMKRTARAIDYGPEPATREFPDRLVKTGEAKNRQEAIAVKLREAMRAARALSYENLPPPGSCRLPRSTEGRRRRRAILRHGLNRGFAVPLPGR
jgi:hypothetical protein